MFVEVSTTASLPCTGPSIVPKPGPTESTVTWYREEGFRETLIWRKVTNLPFEYGQNYSSGKYSYDYGRELTIADVTIDDEGVYTCKVSGKWLNYISTISLTTIGKLFL